MLNKLGASSLLRHTEEKEMMGPRNEHRPSLCSPHKCFLLTDFLSIGASIGHHMENKGIKDLCLTYAAISDQLSPATAAKAAGWWRVFGCKSKEIQNRRKRVSENECACSLPFCNLNYVSEGSIISAPWKCGVINWKWMVWLASTGRVRWFGVHPNTAGEADTFYT